MLRAAANRGTGNLTEELVPTNSAIFTRLGRIRPKLVMRDRRAATGGSNDMIRRIEAEPVKHAHWIINFKRGGLGEPNYVCSSCGKHFLLKTNYCPYCGAKMEVGENADWKDRNICGKRYLG